MRWNYLSIHKLQRLHRWSFGMDKCFNLILYNGYNYLSMPGLKLNHVSKRGHRSPLCDKLAPAGLVFHNYIYICFINIAIYLLNQTGNVCSMGPIILCEDTYLHILIVCIPCIWMNYWLRCDMHLCCTYALSCTWTCLLLNTAVLCCVFNKAFLFGLWS